MIWAGTDKARRVSHKRRPEAVLARIRRIGTIVAQCARQWRSRLFRKRCYRLRKHSRKIAERRSRRASLDEACDSDPVRAVNGVLAAFIARLGSGVRFAAIARGSAGETRAFRQVVRLLKFLAGETKASSFESHAQFSLNATRICGLHRSSSEWQ